jgi:hypothetical protein
MKFLSCGEGNNAPIKHEKEEDSQYENTSESQREDQEASTKNSSEKCFVPSARYLCLLFSFCSVPFENLHALVKFAMADQFKKLDYDLGLFLIITCIEKYRCLYPLALLGCFDSTLKVWNALIGSKKSTGDGTPSSKKHSHVLFGVSVEFARRKYSV